MSEPAATSDHRNGSVVGAARALGDHLIAALPPAFLMLVLLNCVFIGMVFWHEDRTQVLRAQAINKLLDHCLAPPPRGPEP